MEQYELDKIKEVLSIIKSLLINEQDNQIRIRNIYRDNPINFNNAMNRSKKNINNLNKSIRNPYFGRIIFDSFKDNETKDYYIGKNSIIDKDNNIVVLDWRAPISSLYYNCNIGPTSYESPVGTISGDLKLKRQYKIEDSKLIDYYDVDLVSNDQLLQQYLNVNNDKRLKNIVATIQKEQNEIIRKPINKNLIIQGVAGSGKTTIALHRIAYLEYNYRNSIKYNQYLVIGPNTVFMDYIKSVLPDLDVDDVNQYTLEDLLKNIIEEDISFRNIGNKLNSKINGKDTTNIDKYKGSLEFKQLIDSYLKDLVYENLKDKTVSYNGFVFIDNKTIMEYFETANEKYDSLKQSIDKTILYLKKYITNNKDKINYNIFTDKCKAFDEVHGDKEKENQVQEYYKRISKSLDQNCRNEILKIFLPLRKPVTSIYRDFIKNIDKYSNYPELKVLKTRTLSNCKDNEYDFEDIAALLHISSKIKDMKEYQKYSHIVIDEAQDLSVYNFAILKDIFCKATFSIYGDLAQAIYDYRSIENWDEIKDIFNDLELIEINKSYRTTAEIMNAADLVIDCLGMKVSDTVIRHGDNVEIKNADMNDSPKYIVEKIKEYREKGYKSIAIISKNDLLTNYINDDLLMYGIQAQNITSKSSDFNINNDVITISNHVAKGLEFDAVIINNASEYIYDSTNKTDMKLLYVAMTRALHELDIIYDKELTKPLKPLLNDNEKEKNNTKKLILK